MSIYFTPKNHLSAYAYIETVDSAELYGTKLHCFLILRRYFLLIIRAIGIKLNIYCRKQHNEKVSIKRVREPRIKIQNETRIANRRKSCPNPGPCSENHQISNCYASN